MLTLFYIILNKKWRHYEKDFDSIVDFAKQVNTLNIKDPKLIKLSDFTPIDEKAYAAKLAKDETVYKKEIIPVLAKNMNSINVEPAAVDFYGVYRISERLIRANNLDYVNWRIAIRKSPDDFNAASTAANFVWINTALYDSLYTDEDALAFVLAHEMSHHILGHSQRQAELFKRLFNIYNYTYASSNGETVTDATAGLLVNATRTVQLKRVYDEIKMMEFMADTEAFILLTKAGYSPYKAMNALNFLDALPNVKYLIESHPIAKERIASANENISYTNPDWINEGISNIYNSEVLPCKKSSDRVSFIISKSKTDKNFYEPENIQQRLTRYAYTSYLNANMTNAVKYFEKLTDTYDNYVYYLYLSYANEYLYNQSKKEKYLTKSRNAIEKANALKPQDENVKKQKNDIEAL